MSDTQDMFDAQREVEIERRVAQRLQQELSRKLSDPKELRGLLLEQSKELEKVIVERDELREIVNQITGSDGYANCAKVADVCEVYYRDPSGKNKRMGQNYFLQLLELDGIIKAQADGYRLLASHKEYGRTAATPLNGRNRSSVLFNGKGIEYLVKKYRKDDRVFYSAGRMIRYE